LERKRGRRKIPNVLQLVRGLLQLVRRPQLELQGSQRRDVLVKGSKEEVADVGARVIAADSCRSSLLQQRSQLLRPILSLEVDVSPEIRIGEKDLPPSTRDGDEFEGFLGEGRVLVGWVVNDGATDEGEDFGRKVVDEVPRSLKC